MHLFAHHRPIPSSQKERTELLQFQYEEQLYQEDCIANIISIFDALQQNQSFCDVMTEHHARHNYHFPVQDTKNIDIMMETGTGKTFTFIKTMFELNRCFKYKKFIILIPSVAIREGTKTNLADTQYYFKSLYANERDKEIEVFVYESGKLSVIWQYLANPDKFSVLIMTPTSFNSDKNLLNKPLERDINIFNPSGNVPQNYLDCLKMLNPIIIMDEPHKFKGDAFLTYFEGFSNYFLRFGATFPKAEKDERIIPISNVAYTLKSISAFQQNLVKKIVVYTQDIVQNRDSLVKIENNKAIVNTLINGIITQRKLGNGDTYNGKSIRKINKNNIVLSDESIENVDYNLSDDALRAMIKETIKIHFEKEKALFEQGIKALTLFFMESDIELFRGDKPKIKNIFEEEYKEQCNAIIATLDQTSEYCKYLQNDFDSDNALQVHKGYFSGDKGNADEKVKAGVDEILKDKKKLLSFESSTRFIFSIWALQEGWDNPNVFTICKLSNQGSEISKLQQIGRGLRICVNQNLERQTAEKAFGGNQEKFWEVNNLDVVVSDREAGFVETIQNEILSNSSYVNETFTEHLPHEQRKVLENLFANVKDFVQDAKKTAKKKQVRIKQAHLAEFKQLWDAINKNSFYTIENIALEAEQNLLKQIADEIAQLNIDAILLQTIRRELNINKIGEEGSITAKLEDVISYKSKVDYLQFVNDLANNTKTPISFIIKIFNVLPFDLKNKMLANNPAQALKEMSEIVKNNLAGCIKANVKYEIEGKIASSDLCEDKGGCYAPAGSCGKFQDEIPQDFSLKDKWIFEDVIEYDSETERIIILRDPEIESIDLFGKLPRLKIKTPLGDYNPDFCYAVRAPGNKKLFLIVESKGYDTSTKIPASEKGKIDFAKKYFEQLNELNENDKVKISYRERINTTQLSQLINESVGK